MTHDSRRPETARSDLLRSVLEPSPLEEVSEAVSIATGYERTIYVERIGGAWRWSFAHPGGPYPLLRITARFLRVDYRQVTVGFRTVADGVCVLCPDPDEPVSADAWAVIDFEEATSSTVVKDRILHAFEPNGTGRP